MSEYNFDGKVSISNHSIDNSSSHNRQLNVDGDTIRLAIKRDISSLSSGNVGEICWTSNTILGITTYYLAICVEADTWRYVALGSTI